MWKPRRSDTPLLTILVGDSVLDARDGAAYLPVPLQTLRVDAVTGFDLYWQNRGHGNYLLYRQGDLPFTDQHRTTLLGNAVDHLYIASRDRGSYLRYLEGNLEGIVAAASMSLEESSELVYGVALNTVEELFSQPDSGQAVERAEAVVRATLVNLLRGPGSLATMMDLMSADYQLYMHSVNVCVLGLALGHRLGLSPTQLGWLGAGLLLHDIGKTRIDPEILARPDPLSPEEEEVVRRHPLLGAEILNEDARIDSSTLAIVLQHHEKCTGKGYPRGLRVEGIHPFAKIAALVNTFDTLTSHRPYRRGFLSYPAIRLMQEVRGRDFDADMFRMMIRMLAADEGPCKVAA
jgi:HD-GYP domain-containing protein (c-di-GMP phosphodiesterase class II)